LGRFEDAEQALSRAVELGIDADRAGDALRRLVAATYGAAKYAEARQYQETLVAWFDDPSDRLDLGVLRLDAQDPEGAAAAYRAVAENDSVLRILRGRAWNFLALLHDGRGEFDRFHLAVARAIDTSDDVDARENLACRLIDEGRARERAAPPRKDRSGRPRTHPLDLPLGARPARSARPAATLTATCPKPYHAQGNFRPILR
jgi:tetratricopeptide (TPR) repeat protein